MISFEISVNIPDFSKHYIEIQCPYCLLHNDVTIGQIQREDYSICRGCHRTIHLSDHMGSMKRSFNQIRRALMRFGDKNG